jgi:hypothetical protein
MNARIDSYHPNGAGPLNPKSEIRNPKQIRMAEIQNSKPRTGREFQTLELLNFEFVSDFEFRISDLIYGLHAGRQRSFCL